MSVQDHVLEPLVRKLGYWVDLDAADKQAIRDLPHRVKPVERHGFVVREREKATHCCVLLSGFAIRHKIVALGGRQILAVQMKGDVVDLQNSILGLADHSVQMISSGEIGFIPREAVIDIAFRHPRVGRAMWHDTLVDGSIFREWIANVGRRDARTRMAHLLCEFALRLKVAGLGEETAYELPMTQEHLADSTGLTSVHVNRTLKALEADNLIERRSARAVRIGDWKKLAASGDFDSAYLHLRPDDPALD